MEDVSTQDGEYKKYFASFNNAFELRTEDYEANLNELYESDYEENSFEDELIKRFSKLPLKLSYSDPTSVYERNSYLMPYLSDQSLPSISRSHSSSSLFPLEKSSSRMRHRRCSGTPGGDESSFKNNTRKISTPVRPVTKHAPLKRMAHSLSLTSSAESICDENVTSQTPYLPDITGHNSDALLTPNSSLTLQQPSSTVSTGTTPHKLSQEHHNGGISNGAASSVIIKVERVWSSQKSRGLSYRTHWVVSTNLSNIMILIDKIIQICSTVIFAVSAIRYT